jgi:hypothetical protein
MGQFRYPDNPPPFPYGPGPRELRRYDLEVLPTYARQGGAAWRSDFARLPQSEQQKIIIKLIAGAARYHARRRGEPDPIIYEAPIKQLPGGGFVRDESKPLVPLRAEYGGDGRSYEDALKVSKDPVERISLHQAITVQKLLKKWAKQGIVIEFEDAPAPIKTDLPPAPERSKKAAKG